LKLIRRKNKKIVSLNEIIMQLKKENCISDDAKDVLLESFGKHRNLIDWFDQQIGQKKLGKKVSKKYSPEVRQFALFLHFFSTKAI